MFQFSSFTYARCDTTSAQCGVTPERRVRRNTHAQCGITLVRHDATL